MKKLIPFLGAATGVAAFFLVMFQLFWIREAKHIKEEEFNHLVNITLDKIVADLEKKELVAILVNDLSPDSPYRSIRTRSSVKVEQRGQELFTVNMLDSIPLATKFAPIRDPSAIQAVYEMLRDIDSLKRQTLQSKPEYAQVDEESEEKLKYKKILINNFVEKIISVEIPIEQRISKAELDSMLTKEFKEKGLDLNFNYVVRHLNNELVFGTSDITTIAPGDIYSRLLFPADVLSERYFLYVSFPHKHSYIFKSLGATLVASLALLVIVFGVFFGTLMTIVNQKKISQIRSDFVSNMTHELKTPIATISLASEMLNDKNVPPERKNYDYLSDMIRMQAKRLSFLVERTLQLAMFESGRLNLNRRKLDFHLLAGKVLDGFGLQVENRQAILTRAFLATNSMVEVDEVHFSNIFANLIDNALKYSKCEPVIVVSTKNEGGKLLIQVRDNGIGIAKDDLKRVFDQFYRVHTGNVHDVKGFGLGLNYVRKIVEEHEGQIWVESEVGVGSLFNILIPNVIKSV